MPRFYVWLLLVLHLGLARGQTAPTSACDLPQNAALPFCNPALSIDERVADLISRIPLEEMPGLMVHNASRIPSLGIEEYNWKSPSLHGLAPGAGVHFRQPTPYASSFPQILNLASSFDVDLFQRFGTACGNEKRAFYNVGNAGLTYFSPNIDIYRDPRWGRAQETPGEDPHLNSQYAIYYTRGMQTDGPFLKTVVGCKHYAGYGVEDGVEDGERYSRLGFNAIISARDLADTYVIPFKACVMEGRGAGVMCSYNAINGIPGCADKGLLQDTLRDKWGFDGYIVNDNGASHHIWQPNWPSHHYAANQSETVKLQLEAGVDIDLSEQEDRTQVYGFFTLQALEEGLITRQLIERALRNSFRVQFRLGMFETMQNRPYRDITHQLYVDSDAHKAFARESAQKSIVLLKNDGGVLPLYGDQFTGTRKLVLIGPHLNASTDLIGAPRGIPSRIHTPLESILQNYVPMLNLEFEYGCDIASTDASRIPLAVDLAAEDDTEQVVIFVGLNFDVEEESRDRVNITLSGVQDELVARVAAAAARPVVVVLITGGPVDVSAMKANPKVGAILYAGYIGQAGGLAMADVLFGSYNPSGRLAHTFYPADIVQKAKITDMSLRPNATNGNPGRTYRFYQDEAVYPFGHGLGYTTFNYELEVPTNSGSAITVRASETAAAREDCTLTLTLLARNNGERARVADHSVLWYLSPPEAGEMGRPIKSLIYFEKLHNVQPNQERTAEICLVPRQFELANEAGEFQLVTGLWTLSVGDIRQGLLVT